MANRHVDTGITQRGKSYTFVVAMGRDVNGKQIRKTTTFTPPEGLTQKKADKLAKEEYISFKRKCLNCTSLKEEMRFSDLCDEYFEIYAPNKLKASTARLYGRVSRIHLIPSFGNKQLKEISKSFLTDFFCGLEKKGLKTSTIRTFFVAMQSIWNYAMSQDYIKNNPCIGVILPNDVGKLDESKKYLTTEEIPKFLENFKSNDTLGVIVKLLLHTGLRISELLGLQWKDIDFENKCIHINKTLDYTGGVFSLTTPKTKDSKRTIYVGDSVIELLKIQKKRQEFLISIQDDFKHPEMVFTSDDGNYKSRNAVACLLKYKLRNTEFNHVSLHHLRHTNATILLNSGIDIKIVSEHLGHSNIKTTANIYTDVLDSTRKKTAEILELKLR